LPVSAIGLGEEKDHPDHGVELAEHRHDLAWKSP
jgi:hypothetical protein